MLIMGLMMSMFGALYSSVLLGLSPPVAAKTYAEALNATRDAIEMSNVTPIDAIPLLSSALGELEDLTPKLATDALGRRIQLDARLSLARSFQYQGDDTSAQMTMDELIRSSTDISLESVVISYGPQLTQLYSDRAPMVTSSGHSTLEIECKVDCRVYINERLSTSRSTSLYVGTYRVWIESLDGQLPILRTTVELEQHGESTHLQYPVVQTNAPLMETPVRLVLAPGALVDEERPALPTRDTPPSNVERGTHILERWLEIGGILAGIGLVTTGSVLLYLHDRCVPATVTPQGCRKYSNLPGGLTTLILGSAALTTSGVLLAIHETRYGKRRGLNTTLSWSVKF